MTEILTPISTDHSPLIFSVSEENGCLKGKGFWKFNSSLTKGQNYIIEIKKLIRSFCTTNESLYNRQLKWELLKYEVRKFTINYTKQVAEEKRSEKSTKFFLSLEKQRGAQNTIKKLIADDQEIIHHTHILEYIRRSYETPFKRLKQKTAAEIRSFLGHLNIPKLPEDKSKLWEKD